MLGTCIGIGVGVGARIHQPTIGQRAKNNHGALAARVVDAEGGALPAAADLHLASPPGGSTGMQNFVGRRPRLEEGDLLLEAELLPLCCCGCGGCGGGGGGGGGAGLCGQCCRRIIPCTGIAIGAGIRTTSTTGIVVEVVPEEVQALPSAPPLPPRLARQEEARPAAPRLAALVLVLGTLVLVATIASAAGRALPSSAAAARALGPGHLFVC